MIEIRASTRTDLSWPSEWTEVIEFFKVSEVNTYRWDIRIHDIVYEGDSPELFEALTKEIEWEILAGKTIMNLSGQN